MSFRVAKFFVLILNFCSNPFSALSSLKRRYREKKVQDINSISNSTSIICCDIAGFNSKSFLSYHSLQTWVKFPHEITEKVSNFYCYLIASIGTIKIWLSDFRYRWTHESWAHQWMWVQRDFEINYTLISLV